MEVDQRKMSPKDQVRSKIRKICGLAFSPGGASRQLVERGARAAGEVLGLPWTYIDFTGKEARARKLDFGRDSLLIIGFPTYAGRLPNKIVPDLKKMVSGKGSLCIPVVSFGNRGFDNSLAELADIMGEKGFVLLGGAAVPCRHVFSKKIALGQPDQKSLQEFASLVKICLGEGNPGEESPAIRFLREIPGDSQGAYYKPLRKDGRPAVFLKAKPVTDLSLCSHCGNCVDLCPMGSVDREDRSRTKELCIKCQACILHCPKGARSFQDPDYLSHVEMLEENYRVRPARPCFVVVEDQVYEYDKRGKSSKGF